MTELIGYIAAFCTTFSFLPQAIRVIRTRHTRDLSLLMYVLFTFGVAAWLVYGILVSSWPVIVANAITLILALIILIMKLRWG